MNNHINIRDAKSSDVNDIVTVEKLSFPIPWRMESILHDIKENEIAWVIVAEKDGEFAGYADIWIVAGEGMLNNIAVMPNSRGCGVGLAIMKELIRRLSEERVSEMSLEVRAGNIPAISLYKKLGFHNCGLRKKYYIDNGEDAIIMKKEIV